MIMISNEMSIVFLGSPLFFLDIFPGLDDGAKIHSERAEVFPSVDIGQSSNPGRRRPSAWSHSISHPINTAIAVQSSSLP